MITVEQAFELISKHVRTLDAVRMPLDQVLRLNLAETIVSDLDSPPFDKSMLDGFAIDVADSSPTRKITEQVLAGEVPRRSIERGTAIHVMTGAPIPVGANAVVKHEDTDRLDENTVRLPNQRIAQGAGIFRRGDSFRKGQELLAAGKQITAIDVAVLAEVGQSTISVIPRPQVAVLSTGNELVACNQKPGPGQIRNSNGPMLLAAVTEAGAMPRDLETAGDEVDELRSAIVKGLETEVLLITGGVSAGVRDLVPGVLVDLGVEEVFHKVRMKPGKPLWFGTKDSNERKTLVFGLPGNPVSTLVSFNLFVKPVLATLSGAPFSPPKTLRGRLTASAKHRGDRPTYHPCRLDRNLQGQDTVEPLAWRGSADLAALTKANGLLLMPAGDYELAVGTPVDALRL